MRCHDPKFPKVPPMRHYRHLKVEAVELTDKALASADAVVIVTDHSAYDYARIVKHAKLVVDTRNACAGVKGAASKVVRA